MPDLHTGQRLLTAWGLTTTAGWLLTAWLGASGTALFAFGAAGTAIAVWALLMSVPPVLTFADGQVGFHGGAWAALVALGLAENAFVARVGGSHDHGAYGHGGGPSTTGPADDQSGGQTLQQPTHQARLERHS